MPKKCGVVRCSGNYNKDNKCRVFRLPKDTHDRQKWINVLPPRENFVLDPEKFVICERHWPADAPMIKVPGASTRPSTPPSVFENVPASCLPTPKPSPRPEKKEDKQLEYFVQKDTITSLDSFKPDRELLQKYKNLLISRSDGRFVCLFMSENLSQCKLTVIVENTPTLCSPLTCTIYKSGISVPLGKTLHPNNGLRSFSQFFEAVHFSVNFAIPLDRVLEQVVSVLQSQAADCVDSKREKKLVFLTRQLELLCRKEFSMNDYCLALESYPQSDYEQLRDFLTLPSKRKLRYITSSVDRDLVLRETFEKMTPQQKNVFLLVDEVQIRPTVAFAGGVLSGMADNNPDCRATSMLCIMMKALHKGHSIMVSVTPVHRLTSAYQFARVMEAAVAVEKSGGRVIGSITDNHKVNQQYCKSFDLPVDSSAVAKHPLENERAWFLLFDTVHLLKCIRNNWISEKCHKLTIGGQTGSFADVKELYEVEKDSVLKTTPLTQTAVNPSRLQLQNVQHVLRVFNDKVVAALRLKGCHDTADFIQTILNWWNVVNVSVIPPSASFSL